MPQPREIRVEVRRESDGGVSVTNLGRHSFGVYCGKGMSLRLEGTPPGLANKDGFSIAPDILPKLLEDPGDWPPDFLIA